MKKKVYLAGKMRGVPFMNFPAFFAAAKKLRSLGYDVFNPAENDNIRHGTDVSAGNPTGSQKQLEEEHGFSLRKALADDLKFICEHAEAVALIPELHTPDGTIPGWKDSDGAKAEYQTAAALGLEIIFLDEQFNPIVERVEPYGSISCPLPNHNKAETYDEGKEPLAHLPWAAIDSLAMVQAYGHKKYKDFNNYRKGMEVSRNLSCALRHIRDYMNGKDADHESGLNPLAHAMCRIAFVLQNINDGTAVDDRYKKPLTTNQK